MMRLPAFTLLRPADAPEAARMLRDAGPGAALVAGGTDLYPNMKRRHQTPRTLVSVGRVDGMRGIRWEADGELRVGASTSLRALERDPGLRERLPALWEAVHVISTPILRTMGSIGGNVCLDTRCTYYDQSYEWRKAIDFCMKCDGDTCWVAPSSPRCWAVNSSDSVPALIALGATVHLVGPDGERTLPIDELFHDDGMRWLTKAPDEVLTAISVPPQDGAVSTYRKVRRRGAFDFPVLGVAVRAVLKGGVAEELTIVLNAVGSRPSVCVDAMDHLRGRALTDEAIEEALPLAWRPAKPLDNTDLAAPWRKKMVKVEVRRALQAVRTAAAR